MSYVPLLQLPSTCQGHNSHSLLKLPEPPVIHLLSSCPQDLPCLSKLGSHCSSLAQPDWPARWPQYALVTANSLSPVQIICYPFFWVTVWTLCHQVHGFSFLSIATIKISLPLFELNTHILPCLAVKHTPHTASSSYLYYSLKGSPSVMHTAGA